MLAGLPDAESREDSHRQAFWAQEQKEVVQINYKILGEVFSVSGDSELREKALDGGLLPRILDRLAAISGEKPRTFEEANEKEEVDEVAELQQEAEQKAEPEKNTEKKKRKGVGYSSKQGQAFDVSAYLESAK